MKAGFYFIISPDFSDVLATITKDKVYYGSEVFLSVADSKLGALAKRI